MIASSGKPAQWDGDLRAAVPFRHVWTVDFEFNGAPGELPRPVCMVAHNPLTGQTIRLWRDELHRLRQAPFDVGPDSLVIAYAAQAELSCFRALGWPLPVNVLDLFVEHRVDTNGLPLTVGNSLLCALAYRGIGHIDAGEKDAMRRLIVDNDAWTATQRAEIMEYCESDVIGLTALLPVMAPHVDWPRALFRGQYTAAVAQQQHDGTPIDLGLYRRLAASWDLIKQLLVHDVNGDFEVYENDIFKVARFAVWLKRNNIRWPRSPSGDLRLDDDTFGKQELRYPQLRPLRELRNTLSKLRFTGLSVGADGRNRCPIWPFSATTGRNQPSNTGFIFGPAKWMRGLIRPSEGRGIAYIDFNAQEIGIGAALSGDERMIEAYGSGDPYLGFAKLARLVPADATSISHPAQRELAKGVMLATNYGMGENTLAERLGISPAEARELLRLHRAVFSRFWRWSNDQVSAAMLTNRITSVFGWPLRVGPNPNPRSLMNFPMQANGAEMMRIAAIAAAEAGITVCAPIHDAFLIEAPLDRLDKDVARMSEIMTRAGNVVTGGLDIRTDANVVRWPDRYMTDAGRDMWDRVMRLLERVEAANE